MENIMNTGRQKNIDYAKGLAVIFMILIHVMSWPESEFLYGPYGFIVDDILGGYLSAPVFMFSMGVGLAYSRNSDPARIIRRGIKLFLLSYLVNVIRAVLPLIITFIAGGWEEYIVYLFFGEILGFAGLAMILFGILKKYLLSDLTIAIISVVMNVLTACIPMIITVEPALALSAGLFIPIQYADIMISTFPLFSWFVFVAVGNYFGDHLKKARDLNSFYGTLTVLGAVMTAVFLVMEKNFDLAGLFTGFRNAEYYNHPVNAVISIGIIFAEFGLLHFAVKHLHPVIDKLMLLLSDCVNEIFIVSWTVIMNVNFVIFGLIFPGNYDLPVYFALFAATLVVSVIIGAQWKKRKRRKLKMNPGILR